MIKRTPLPGARIADVFVNGATVGGIFAAISAKQQGKSVLIIEQHPYHIGGVMTGGLSLVDIYGLGLTSTSALMPLAHDYFTRIAAYYGETIVDFFTTNADPEPKIAMRYLVEMLNENEIEVVNGLRIDSVNKSTDNYITEVILTDGTVVKSNRFIDASYEGDLMMRSNVDTTIGREANATYGETYNGGRPLEDIETGYPIDPYIIEGNPGSGLLNNVNATITAQGAVDSRVQGYCYRLCMTKVHADRITPWEPDVYDAADYEYMGRLWDAGYTGSVLGHNAIQNDKRDFSATHGDYGLNITGEQWNYANLSYADRDAFAERLKQYSLGLFKFIREDPRAPEAIVINAAQFGFCADEFIESKGFSPQVYVREANRLVGDYVLSEPDIVDGTALYPLDHIGHCGYPYDSHTVSWVDSAGVLKIEGNFLVNISAVTPIPFSCILPKASQCKNLAVIFGVSATHVAFGSTRMEPTSMGLGEAAGHASSLSIDQDISMSELDASYIQNELNLNPVGVLMNALNATGNGVVTTVGLWTLQKNSFGGILHGRAHVHDGSDGKGTKTIRFTPNASLMVAGDYEISLKCKYANDATRSDTVPVTIGRSGGVSNVTSNQKLPGNLAGEFESLGTFTLDGDGTDYVEIGTAGTTGYVAVNAVCFSHI